MRSILQWIALWLAGSLWVAHAGVTSEQQHTIRENTFEVVLKKPEKDPVSYEKPLPLDLLPFIERNDAYRSIGTAFALGNNTYVTAGHVFAAGIGSQFGPPALRRSDGTVFDVDKILKFSIHEDYVMFSLRKDPAPAGFQVDRTPKIDEAVLAVGNALGEGIVIRDGLFTSETAEAQDGRWKWIRFSAAASPGNSGGPLCDADGKVIGIVIGKSPNENLNYSMPIGRVLDGEPQKARFDQKSLMGLPYLHGTVTQAYKDEFGLPLTWPAFVTTIQKLFARHGDDARAQLLKAFQDSLFPKGPGAASLLFEPNHDVEPRMIVQEADGTWTAPPLGYRNTDLPDDGIVGVATGASARLVHMVRSAAASDDAFYNDSKAFMDLALKGLDLRRAVGADQVRVTSLGPAQIDAAYTDSYGRKWQDRVYAVPYLDAYLVAMLLPTPEGYGGLTLLAPSISLYEAREQAHLLAGQMDVAYRGTLTQWRAALRRPAWLPAALSQVKLDKAEGWTLQTPRFVSGVPANVLPLTDKSLLTMTMGFMNDGAKTVWDIQGVRWDLDNRKEAGVELWRRAQPPAEVKLELRNRFDSIRQHRSPFDGLLSRETGETYGASTVIDVPGQKGGTVLADVEYGITVHLVGHPNAADASNALSRMVAATRVLERGQRTGPALSRSETSALDVEFDDFERQVTAAAQKQSLGQYLGRDIRGHQVTDDVHDCLQTMRNEMATIKAYADPDASEKWLSRDRQRIAWLQSYWAEYPSLRRNRDMWRSFLEMNQMPNNTEHDASVIETEHTLLDTLDRGTPSESWARIAHALRTAYIGERNRLVKSRHVLEPSVDRLAPRASPCAAAAVSTTGGKLPRLTDNGHTIEEYWPIESRRLGEEGTVLVRLNVSPAGCVARLMVIGFSGSDMIDAAALRYMEASTWIPAGASHAPVETTVNVPIIFKLQ